MQYKLLFLLITLLGSIYGHGQTLGDAVRFSVYDNISTARSTGVGGSLGALGADFSVASTNPAGIAMFRSSEFMFTPILDYSGTDANLVGSDNGSQSDNKFNFNFGNVGVVFANRPRSTRWTTSNIAIGINRITSFHQRIEYNGTTRGTIIDRFIELADGFFPENLDPFEAGPAFDVGAIFPLNGGSGDQYDADLFPNDFVTKSQSINRRGGINELAFSYAANLNEKFMFGATVGIPFVRFEEDRTYRETDTPDEFPIFNSLRFEERLRTTGAGINLKLGAIWRASQMIRVGLAVHTPTGFRLEDDFSTTVAYDFTLDGFEPQAPVDSPNLNNEYRFRTPWRFIGSLGLLIGKNGFLSGEVEYIGYNGIQYRADNDVEFPIDEAIINNVNNQIDNQLESTINFRFGGEVAWNKLRFRGGLNLRGTPYIDDSELDTSLSIGTGFRFNRWFLDVAYRRIVNNESLQPYIIGTTMVGQTEISQPNVNIEDNRNLFSLTIGTKF